MKRILFIAGFLLVSFALFASDFNKGQLQIRMEIVKFLDGEGISSKIDDDGDVVFRIDDLNYHFIINKSWTGTDGPFVVTLYLGFRYNEVNSKENMLKCIDLINQYDVVKLYCGENNYSYMSDIICHDIQPVKDSFRPLLEQYDKARSRMAMVLESELKGVDLINERSKVLDYALELYKSKDYARSIALLDYLVAAGYEKSYGYLGLSYELGTGVDRNEDMMAKMYDKAIKAGYNWCAYKLGKYYEGKKKYDLAIRNYVICSSNEGTYRSDAFFAVGNMYENGLGTTRDIQAAIKNYRKSVEFALTLKCPARMALIRLGEQVEPIDAFIDADPVKIAGLTEFELYKKGNEFETGKNVAALSLPYAYSYYKASADLGYTRAMIKMGDIYMNEFYPFMDKVQSDKYYQKAFKILKKRIDSDGAACYDLGCMFYYGKGTEVNRSNAEVLFKHGASKGDPYASYMASVYYLESLDYPEAFKCLKKAADAGIGEAMYELAKLYESGLGVRYSREEAITWYQKCYEADCEKSNESLIAKRKLETDDGKY